MQTTEDISQTPGPYEQTEGQPATALQRHRHHVVGVADLPGTDQVVKGA